MPRPKKDTRKKQTVKRPPPKSGAQRVKEFTERASEIGLPKCECLLPIRRDKCRGDLLQFGYTYFQRWCYRAPSPIIIEYTARLQGMILVGGRSAIAVPRGYAKTTWAKIAILWGVLYGHIRYPVVFAASDTLAQAVVSDLRDQLESNDTLHEDFALCTHPIRALEGTYQRAASQRMNGVRTSIQLKASHIRLPKVEGMPFSGAYIVGRGITSGFLGLVRDGMRPDFALLDDVQSMAAAESPSKIKKLEKAIQGGVLGLGGHERPISVIMACTVNRLGDLSDLYLDPDLHPEFRPIRYGLVIKWPDASEYWERYRELWKDDQQTGGTSAASFYAHHRAEMDAGAITNDPDLFDPRLEVSAIQHAYHALYVMGMADFSSQMQNRPESSSTGYELNVKDVAAQINHLTHYECPPDARSVVAFSDINNDGVRWALVAYTKSSGGVIIDYGKYPRRGVLVPRNASEAETQRKVHDGLKAVAAILTETIIKRGAARLSLRAWAVDAGYKAEVVHAFARSVRLPFAVLPSRGFAAARYMPTSKGLVGEAGYQCHISESQFGQFLAHNSDYWRETAQRCFLVDPLSPGSLSLWGSDKTAHWEFAENVCAEVLVDKALGPRGVQFFKWTMRPNTRNDYLDCVVGCYALGAWFRCFDPIASEERMVVSAGGKVQPRPVKKKYKEKRKCKVSMI